MNATSTNINSLEYFHSELIQFRTFMSNKGFWKKPDDIRDRVVKSLTITYLNINESKGAPLSEKERDSASNLMLATLMEYGQRERMILTS